jgi:hypothetical protein
MVLWSYPGFLHPLPQEETASVKHPFDSFWEICSNVTKGLKMRFREKRRKMKTEE